MAHKRLTKTRASRAIRNRPPLRISAILRWAAAHHEKTGRWPSVNSGPVKGVPGEHWNAINTALFMGYRGLPARSSLAKLLDRRMNGRCRKRPASSPRHVLKRPGRHDPGRGMPPRIASVRILGSHGDVWRTYRTAALLDRRRSAPLTTKQILKWARVYRARTGKWPTVESGRIAGTSETWRAVNQALYLGRRGLPRSPGSLSKLLRPRWRRRGAKGTFFSSPDLPF